MFKKVLVTLDGSEFAERALAPALAIARQFGAALVLLRVVVPEEVVVTTPGLGAIYYDVKETQSQREHDEADGYLYGVKTRLVGGGLAVRSEVISGAPPEVILDVAATEKADLIVMSTHGRSGFSRLLYGSVAEAVLRGARQPVLLVPIHE